MFESPIDAWYVWIGVSLVSLAVLGVATTAVPSQPSQAESAAETIDTVAASQAPAGGTVPIEAERVRVESHRITIERGTSGAGGAVRDLAGSERAGDGAIVRSGPITPATRGSPLREVALGAPPADVFDSPEALERAATDARADERVVESPGDELIVRSVQWEEVDVTLVTA